MMDRTGKNTTTIVPRRKIIRKEMTKRKAMPSVNRTSKIPVVPPSWKSVLHMAKEKMDMMMSALKG